MTVAGRRAGHGFRWTLCALAGTIAFQAIACGTAEAKWKWRKSNAAPITADSRYADIVVDGNTGSTLHASNADSLRHPASLTKIMTLYLLFERLESGKVKLDSDMPVSPFAASQAPTKIGVKAGQSLQVEDAIKALVTKSANDAAVVIAEYLAGDEDEFAKLMTRKARALGMSKTTYMNASGLPDDDQVTTARDQATLGLAIQERFPRYYKYFSTASFSYKGRGMRNHNKLLGRVVGVDGIKTGYTNSSGFNLTTSMRRGNRHVVAVVLGGRSGGQRDARMTSLLEESVVVASATPKAAPRYAEAAEPAETRAKPKAVAVAAPLTLTPEAVRVEAAKQVRSEPAAAPLTTSALPPPELGSTAPIRPTIVKTLSVKPGSAVQTATLAPIAPEPAPAAPVRVAEYETEALPPPPGSRPGVLGVLAMRAMPSPADLAPIEPKAVETRAAEPRTVEPKPVAAPVLAAATPPREISAARETAPESKIRHGWMIQVGAFPDESEAKQQLSSAKSKAAGLLGRADPFTETVVKGEKKLYRARFAGLEKDQAESACKTLKRNDIACLAFRN